MSSPLLSRLTYLLPALLLAPAAALAAADDLPTTRFVLAAGANDGGHGRATLRYAVTDARNFADVMWQMGGVQGDDGRLLADPDRAAFEEALVRLAEDVRAAKAARRRTEVMLYYSGHADEEGLLLGEERLGYRRLRGLLDEVDADVRIAVLDACASGAITRIKGGQRREAFVIDTASNTRGYAFLTSSSAEEAAQESDRIGASYFTHYLVTGMRGAADVTADGRVSLAEAYRFAFDETLARTVELSGGAQHPAYDMNLSGSGDVILTDVRRVSAAVNLADDVEGRLFVRSADRRLVAELYKAPGRGVELGLEPDDYDIYLEQRRELSVARRQLADGQRLQLAAADFEPAPREEAVARGGPFLGGPSAPEPARPAGRFRVELHFGGIGPEPEAHRVLAAGVPDEELSAADSRFPAIVESAAQVQPWGALSGLTLGYAPDPRWEVTLSWGALTSEVDEDLSTGGAEPRTLQEVQLTSVLLGARWYPLASAGGRTTRWRPFASLAAGTFEGREEGVVLGGRDGWSQTRRVLGGQLGGGVDLDLTRSLTVGAHLAWNWMARFDEPVGGRRDYRGGEFRLAASWRFGG
jgi:hypothetical protein